MKGEKKSFVNLNRLRLSTWIWFDQTIINWWLEKLLVRENSQTLLNGLFCLILMAFIVFLSQSLNTVYFLHIDCNVN